MTTIEVKLNNDLVMKLGSKADKKIASILNTYFSAVDKFSPTFDNVDDAIAYSKKEVSKIRKLNKKK